MDPFLTGVITQYLGDVISWESHRWNYWVHNLKRVAPVVTATMLMEEYWQKKSFGNRTRLLSKTWATFSLFWHQNGRVITLRISKNMLPKLGVIIERWLLPLAAWQCQLRRWLCSENWATSTLAWIKTDVISNILTFRQYPKVSRLILFSCQ